MNKTVKGSLAGAAGIALLMGGFGSYAMWSDSATQTGDSITSGNLDVKANDDISWTDGVTTVTDTNNWNTLMVPGDTVTRTQSFTFTGAGKNLTGAIRFVPGGETEPAKAAAGSSFADNFSIAVTVDGDGVTQASPACWNFATDSNEDFSRDIDTQVDYTLTADNQDLQDATATLDDSTFTITQGSSC